ncbi:cell death specification protein 2-like protein [Dinothrombium tinctorium]|uniref:Cell death specification protein 2-like protein n=2 Tax=Dinothrombium tinctorium TaxID=1965070 RepID=A0A3S3RZK5_9ACAR|nr:cell death specification protein 2-like protein [Dinothrombium tinctorium]
MTSCADDENYSPNSSVAGKNQILSSLLSGTACISCKGTDKSADQSLCSNCKRLTDSNEKSSSSKEVNQVVVEQPLDLSGKKQGIYQEVSKATIVAESTNPKLMTKLKTSSTSSTEKENKIFFNETSSIREKIRNASPSLSQPETDNFVIIDGSSTLSPTNFVFQATSRNGEVVVNDTVNSSYNSLPMSPLGMEQSQEVFNPSPRNQACCFNHFASSNGTPTTRKFENSDLYKNLGYLRSFGQETISLMNFKETGPSQDRFLQEAALIQRSLAPFCDSDESYRLFRKEGLLERKIEEWQRKMWQNFSPIQPSNNSQEFAKADSSNSLNLFDKESSRSNGSDSDQSNSFQNDDTSQMSNEETNCNDNSIKTSQKPLDTNSPKKGMTFPDSEKDAAYWERRRKNNEAAKKSREARRAKEAATARRASFLEQENMILRAQLYHQSRAMSNLNFNAYYKHQP